MTSELSDIPLVRFSGHCIISWNLKGVKPDSGFLGAVGEKQGFKQVGELLIGNARKCLFVGKRKLAKMAHKSSILVALHVVYHFW